MAATIVTPAKMSKIMKKMTHGRGGYIGSAKRRCWYIADADPAVAAASAAVAPVQVGDFAYRVDSDEAFICSVAPAPATASTFVQLNA